MYLILLCDIGLLSDLNVNMFFSVQGESKKISKKKRDKFCQLHTSLIGDDVRLRGDF